jgi:hypothetical protein
MDSQNAERRQERSLTKDWCKTLDMSQLQDVDAGARCIKMIRTLMTSKSTCVAPQSLPPNGVTA